MQEFGSLTCPSCSSFMKQHCLMDTMGESFMIDYCTGCGGFWLDRGEFMKIVKAGANTVPAKILNTPNYKESDEFKPEGTRNCPRCSVVMPIKEIKGVNLDFCPQCAGIWFDKNELGDLINNKDAVRDRRGEVYDGRTNYDGGDNYNKSDLSARINTLGEEYRSGEELPEYAKKTEKTSGASNIKFDYKLTPPKSVEQETRDIRNACFWINMVMNDIFYMMLRFK